MSNELEDLENKPPFFKNWKGLYAFVLIFEVVIVLLFIVLTKFFSS